MFSTPAAATVARIDRDDFTATAVVTRRSHFCREIFTFRALTLVARILQQ
jgi:hypothetical protein